MSDETLLGTDFASASNNAVLARPDGTEQIQRNSDGSCLFVGVDVVASMAAPNSARGKESR